MKTKFCQFIVVTMVVFLAGCANNLFVVNSNQQDARLVALRKAAAPCFLSQTEQLKYIAAIPVLTAPGGVVIPQKATDDRVDGCAGVEFQLDKNGAPANLKIVKEYPLNYGFGDAVLDNVKIEKFRGSTDLKQWYYISSAMVSSTMITPRK